MRAVSVLGAVALLGGSVSGQTRPLPFNVPVENELRSGDTHEFTVSAAAGDLVSGTLDVRGIAALLEIRNSGNDVVRLGDGRAAPGASGRALALYFSLDDPPDPVQIGFVASAAGVYRVQIKAFDRFDFRPPPAPRTPVPVVGTARGSYVLRLDSKPVAVRMLAADAPPEQYSSPRLRRLSEQLQQGEKGALESFWREVTGKSPLVEDIPGNDRDADVTFLWREIYDTRNVFLEWAVAGPDSYMSRLPGTDVWYKTLRLRRGTRLEYGISPNHRSEDRWATMQVDPLNPRRFPDDPTHPYFHRSVLDMPGAPDEQWALRTPLRRGTIEERTVTSVPASRQRQIWIYTPPGYSRSSGPYPLVVLLDGSFYVDNLATLDNLINEGRIRPAIVCFETRNRDYIKGASRPEQFGEVLMKELLPLLRASYAISTNPADVVIGGYSAGGRAAAEIAFLHPEVFGNVLSQSGAFRQQPAEDEMNDRFRLFIEAPRKPIRFYMEVGRYENLFEERPLHEQVLDGRVLLLSNRHLRDILRAKGYDVTYREVGGDHGPVHWRAMLADGLMTLLK